MQLKAAHTYAHLLPDAVHDAVLALQAEVLLEVLVGDGAVGTPRLELLLERLAQHVNAASEVQVKDLHVVQFQQLHQVLEGGGMAWDGVGEGSTRSDPCSKPWLRIPKGRGLRRLSAASHSLGPSLGPKARWGPALAAPE